MRPHFASIILLLPSLLSTYVLAIHLDTAGQVILNEDKEWNLTSFTLPGCGEKSTNHKKTDDQGCSPLNGGVESRSYRFYGQDKFKVCLWGDGDCSKTFYRGGTQGDPEFTCHNVLGGLTAESFSVVKKTKTCFTDK